LKDLNRNVPSILAIDQGTTSTKAYVSTDGGAATLVGSRTHRQIHPYPGWVEHDPIEISNHVLELAMLAGSSDAIGLANQGETVVAWDAETKRPLYNAIVWQDERTREDVERLRSAGLEALTLECAGLPLDPYFSASKLRWLLDNAEDARSLARTGRLRIGTSDAFLLDRICGAFCTDVSTASRTSLVNLSTLEWDQDLCEAFGVPVELLPAIVPTTGGFGKIAGGGAISASAVDQQAALFGHDCRRPGEVKITFGTGAFALGLTGEAPVFGARSGLLPTCAWRLGQAAPVYALDGGILTAGAAVEWLRSVGLLDTFEELDAFEGPYAASRGVMFVPALSGLGCPHWDRSARGLWIGMNLATSRADLCRAVVEGIAFRTAELIDAFNAVTPCTRIAIDGGLTQSRYFCGFLTEAIGGEVLVANTADVTAVGLLQLASLGASVAPPATEIEYRRVASTGAIKDIDRHRFAEALRRASGWTARMPDSHIVANTTTTAGGLQC
jgi:glycerol kinase